MMARMRVRGTGSTGRVDSSRRDLQWGRLLDWRRAEPLKGDCSGRSTSSLPMRPPVPVPVIRLKSIPCSLAMRRASGEERSTCATCGGADSWASVLRPPAVGQPFGQEFVELPRRCHRRPSLADHRDHRIHLDRLAFSKRISASTPATGEGISASTLSVEISKSGSSIATVSPMLFEPFGDRALEDRLAHLGHDDFRWHASSFALRPAPVPAGL